MFLIQKIIFHNILGCLVQTQRGQVIILTQDPKVETLLFQIFCSLYRLLRKYFLRCHEFFFKRINMIDTKLAAYLFFVFSIDGIYCNK